jgi:tight adherence protein B
VTRPRVKVKSTGRASRSAFAVAAVSLLCAALVGIGGTAFADDTATIDHAKRDGDQLQLLFSVPGTDLVDLASAEVNIDGKHATATTQNAADSDLRRTAVLAFDTSNSMAGAKFTQAKAAALSYLDAVPDNVYVGMVTFDDSVDVARAPTLNRDEMRATIRSLRLAESTSLNQGVMKAVSLTGKLGGRNVLVLSDGRDTTGTPLTDVLDKVKASGAKVDVIALQRSGPGVEGLARIAKAGKGAVIQTVDPATLTTTFQNEALNLTRQVLVTADVPPGQKTDGNVEVSIDAGDQTWTDTAYTTVRAAPKPEAAPVGPVPAPTSSFALTTPMLAGAASAIGLGLLGIVLAMSMRAKPETTSVEEQIGVYGATGKRRAGKAKAAPSASITDAARARATAVLANNRGLEAKIAKRLEGAATTLRPAEWLLLHGGIAIVTALVFLLLSGGNVILLLVGLLVGAWLPWFFLGFKAKRRIKAFQAALPDTLQLMAGSLSAGLSLAQSTDTIVREGSEPITSEFKRVIVESRLGVPLEDAMEGVAERMESRDFEWVVMAIRIQREVGGNLAELLLTVAGTLREREYIRRHVRALSAEGRLSCYVLGGLPPGFLAYLALSRWTYVEPLFTTPIGYALLAGMGVLLTVGIVWMSKVSKVEI